VELLPLLLVSVFLTHEFYRDGTSWGDNVFLSGYSPYYRVAWSIRDRVDEDGQLRARLERRRLHVGILPRKHLDSCCILYRCCGMMVGIIVRAHGRSGDDSDRYTSFGGS